MRIDPNLPIAGQPPLKVREFFLKFRDWGWAPDAVSQHFVFRVAKAVVFGSYLSAKARISDIDIAILLEPKEKDREKREALKAKRIQKAHEAGRTFHNIMDQVYWPEKEVLLFLKSRSRSLSFHSMEELTRMTSEFRVLFEECVK